MLKEGDIVRINSKVPNEELVGSLAIIIKVNLEDNYIYRIRFVHPRRLGEHAEGGVRPHWIDKV
jgi:hypothetical protein